MDYLRIFKTLNAEKIKYIVVGGLAVNFYGIPRMTYDVDLLLYMEDKNLEKVFHLMKRWGFKARVGVKMEDLADEVKRRCWIKEKNMKAFNFVNPDWAISEIDIIIDSPVDYGKALKNVKRLRMRGISVPVISKDDLIEMKKASNRQQDKKDIFYLKQIKDE